MLRIALAALVITVSSTPAFAQKIVRGEDKIIYRGVTRIDITDVELGAGVLKPAGQYTLIHGKVRFDSLISLRRHFQRELQASVANL